MSTARRLGRFREVVASRGLIGALKAVRDYVRWRFRGSPTSWDDEYSRWLDAAESVCPTHTDSEVGFTVVMPVYNTDPDYLSDAVESVVAQTHQKWQLVMVDDASTRSATSRMAVKLAATDERIFLTTLGVNGGIAVATNAGIDSAIYEWIAFMDHDDRLHRDALAWFSACAESSDLVYSDEDQLDVSGQRQSPKWKPAWSSRLLLNINYINHLTAIRTDVVREVGGIRVGYDGAQDHDLLLRVSEVPGLRVTHIPHVLYHWRIFPESFSQTTESSLSAERSGLQAVADAIERRGWHADSSLSTGSWFNYRPRFHEASPRPTVKIVILIRDHVRLLRRCVSGVFDRTDGVDLHVVIVDNGSVKKTTAAYLAELDDRDDVTVIRVDDEFNYSALCNQGSRVGPNTEYLLMLKYDVEVLGRKWLQQMTGWLVADAAVCGVGTKLLYPDGTIQHGGVVLGLGGVSGNYADGAQDRPYLNNHHDQAREVTAVTAAALLVRSEDFAAVGGFRTILPIVHYDTDLCLKLSRETGGSIVYDPTYPLNRLGSASRSAHASVEEYGASRFRFLWSDELVRGDPFYSPHLSRSSPDNSLREIPDDATDFVPRFTPRSNSGEI